MHDPTKPVEYKLLYPVEYDGKTHDTITLQPILAKHCRGIPASGADNDKLLDIAISVSGLAPAFFDRLYAADRFGLTDLVFELLMGGRQIRTS